MADYAASTVTLALGEHRRTGEAWEAVEGTVEELDVGTGEPLRAELASFVDACRGARPALVPASDGVRAMEIVDAAARSARTGQTVALA